MRKKSCSRVGTLAGKRHEDHLRYDSTCTSEHPSRPFLDQTLLEGSGVLVERTAKHALKRNLPRFYWARLISAVQTQERTHRT